MVVAVLILLHGLRNQQQSSWQVCKKAVGGIWPRNHCSSQFRGLTSLFNIFKKEGDKYSSMKHGLQSMYEKKLEPLESAYHFHEFHSPRLSMADFGTKASIMCIGQYSTGKTTFIQLLLGKDYPGQRIGPEPTTDKFVVIKNGQEDSIVPGNALVVDRSEPYAPLSKFGNKFLNRFQCSRTNSPVLDNLTVIDTPGILAGEKQHTDRGYDYTEVIHWFAERVDRIVLLFDAHKLDVSDEFKETIEILSAYEDKLRVVLNKADRVNSQQLMRVYGALMWSLGKIVHTPEVARVYIGSFWKNPLEHTENKLLFELEHEDLINDMQGLPKQNSIRKLNDFIRRARLAKVHAYIVSELKNEMPMLFGKEAKKQELLRDLSSIYRKIQRKYNISSGDFPDVHIMRNKLIDYDFSKFRSLDTSLIQSVDDMLHTGVPGLMDMLSEEKLDIRKADVSGGVFTTRVNNPFQSGASEGINMGKFDRDDWVVNAQMAEYEESFKKLVGTNGKISGAQAREAFVKSRLPNTELALIWQLSDVDNDGFLDLQQWALANHLVDIRLQGHNLPSTLPEHLIPPSQRPNSSL